MPCKIKGALDPRHLHTISCKQPIELPPRFDETLDFKLYSKTLLECNEPTIEIAASARKLGNRDAVVCKAACQCEPLRWWKGLSSSPKGHGVCNMDSKKQIPAREGPKLSGFRSGEQNAITRILGGLRKSPLDPRSRRLPEFASRPNKQIKDRGNLGASTGEQSPSLEKLDTSRPQSVELSPTRGFLRQSESPGGGGTVDGDARITEAVSRRDLLPRKVGHWCSSQLCRSNAKERQPHRTDQSTQAGPESTNAGHRWELDCPMETTGYQPFRPRLRPVSGNIFCSFLLQCETDRAVVPIDKERLYPEAANDCISACPRCRRVLEQKNSGEHKANTIEPERRGLPVSHARQYFSLGPGTRYEPRDVDTRAYQRTFGRSLVKHSSTAGQSKGQKKQNTGHNVQKSQQQNSRSTHQPEDRSLRIVPLETFTGDGYLHCDPATTKVTQHKGGEQAVTCRAVVRCLKGAVEKRTLHTPDKYLQNCRAQCHCSDDLNGVSARSVGLNRLERTSSQSRLGLDRGVVSKDKDWRNAALVNVGAWVPILSA